MNNLSWRLVLVAVAIAVGVALGSVTNHRNGFKELSVKLGSGLRVSIYKDLGGDAPYNYDIHGQPVATLNSSQTVKLKKTVYDFVVNDPQHQYETPVTKFVVTSGTNSITIDPAFTDQKLASLLVVQRPAAQQALRSAYPSLTNFYAITSDQLYGHGEWYGAVLQPKQSSVDKLRVIMEYKDGQWVTAAKPQISIGIPSHPLIPSNVIDSTDAL